MFIDQYKESQPYAYKLVEQSLSNKKISHAYIIETNGYDDADNFIKAFVKDILCMDVDNEEKKNNISIQIDNDEYIEVETINTSSLEIKKDQIKKLQSEFKNKAITGSKKIYIISEANKFNDSSANTILKFLEEPEDNIIAILVVNNRYSLLDTIISRCQLISLNDNNKKDIKSLINIEDIDKDEFLNNVFNFVKFYEKNKKKTLLFEKSNFLSYFNNREKIMCAFEIMKLLYLDALKKSLNIEVKYFDNYDEAIKIIIDSNDYSNLLNKIDVIVKCIDRINSYVNNNMLLDYFIIETCR